VKLFIIASRFPYPIEKGDKLRLYHQIRYLSRKYKIYLIALSDIPVAREHIDHLQQFVEEVHLFRLRKIGIFWSLLFGFFSQRPFQVLYFFNKKIRRKIAELHKGISPDIIYNQLIRTTEYTRGLEGFKVLDYMDAFSTGMHKRIGTSKWPMRWIYQMEEIRLVRYEKSIYPFYNKHFIISEQDRERLLRHIDGKIYIVPNGVDTEFFRPVSKQKKYDLCFAGNMGYRPNVIASEYICQKILPGLLKNHPTIKIVLAGTRPDVRVKKLAGKHVAVTGWMEDIRDAYNESRLFIAPIFTGIGQQNKILEAMAMELPCVSTSSVNNPIGAVDGISVVVADDKQAFIEKISYLLADDQQAQKIGKEGRALVAGKYSWETQVNTLINLIEN
jgi:sugar transferase (PEP-CTERM/EpsH1 system associated)